MRAFLNKLSATACVWAYAFCLVFAQDGETSMSVKGASHPPPTALQITNYVERCLGTNYTSRFSIQAANKMAEGFLISAELTNSVEKTTYWVSAEEKKPVSAVQPQYDKKSIQLTVLWLSGPKELKYRREVYQRLEPEECRTLLGITNLHDHVTNDSQLKALISKKVLNEFAYDLRRSGIYSIRMANACIINLSPKTPFSLDKPSVLTGITVYAIDDGTILKSTVQEMFIDKIRRKH